ncbi:MAG: phosphatase [uncultured bacterium]|nr:MAG: phosphatase [uncultured bacterium]
MNWNQRLFFKINALIGKNRWLDAFGRAGAEWVIVGMGGWYGAISFILYYGNPTKMWLPIFALAIAGGVAWLTSNLIAEFVQEVRPRMTFPECKILFWPMYSWKSFPSDHTIAAFLIFFFAIIFNFPTAWMMLPLVLWVGWGRVYAGVHYPGDVLGGFGLSVIISIISYFILHFYHFV